LIDSYKKLTPQKLKYAFAKCRFKTEPMLHQYQTLAFCLDHPRAGLFLDIGLGKTLAALYAAKMARSRCILIICPNSVVKTWRDEIEKHTDFSYVTLIGSRGDRIRKMNSHSDCYIINYEGLKTVWARVQQSGFSGKTKYISDPTLTKDSPFDCVIIDEAHNIAHHDCVQSRIAANLTQHADNVFLLTGTPISKSLLDLWGILYALDHGETLGTNFFAFRNKHFRKYGYKWVLKKGSTKKILDAVADRIIGYSRYECFDLPPVTYQRRWVTLTEEQLRIQHDLMGKLRTEIEDKKITVDNILVRCLRLAQITSGFIQNKDVVTKLKGGNPKLDELDDVLKEISCKVIIYHRYTQEAHDIEKLLKKRGIRFASLRGEIKDKDAQQDKFINDPKVQVMVAHPKCGGEGRNLQAASVGIFYSNDYDGATTRRQAEGRIYRKGQTRPCLFIDIVVKNSIIERGIKHSMMTKQQIADIVLARVQKNS